MTSQASAPATTLRQIEQPQRKPAWGKWFAWLGMILLLVVTLFPFYWMLRTALTQPSMVFKNPSALLPPNATLINFQRVLGLVDAETNLAMGGSGQSINFLLAMRNSLIATVLIVVGQVTFCAMAAYAFARLKFPFREQIFFLYISALMVPAIVTLIPNFILMRQLNWLNSFQGIVAPYFLMTPFAVFFLRQFFLGVNREIEEAARIDGASIARSFVSVVVPITMPALTTMAIVTLINSWNNYLWPLIIAKDESVRVLTVALGVFRTQTPQGAPDWTGLMAGTTLAIIPTFVLFLLLAPKVLDSIQFTGIK